MTRVMPPTELATYFIAERQGGFFLVALALVSLGFAAGLWANRSAFVAMAWPLVVLGSLQLVIGLVVALRLVTVPGGGHNSARLTPVCQDALAKHLAP